MSSMSFEAEAELIQQQIREAIQDLTERGIWPPEDGQIVSLRVPIGGGNKDAVSPASKAAVEEMMVAMIVAEAEGEECSICLNGYKIGEEVKVMPCTHQYHSGCIDTWLRIHGSCPFCRYEMPKRQGRGRELAFEFVYRHPRTQN